MKTYPLRSMSVKEARDIQFKLVDTITKHFSGKDMLTLGDLGVVPGLNKPSATLKAEKVLAHFFGQEDCVLVRGAGTGAIRWGLYSMIKPGGVMLIHDAPIYPTTAVTIESMGLVLIRADFNQLDKVKDALENNKIDCALVQYTRQRIDDRYEMGDIINLLKNYNIPVITDDNYAVMKVKKIGVQYGADLSAFSMFKLLGPEGVGCVVGKSQFIQKINKSNYSGGGQVQGHEALEALRGLVYAPVALAIQAEVGEEIVERLNGGEVKGVKGAFLANAQSKVILVEFEENIADKVLKHAENLGGAPNPIGAESKYEIVPMFYRVSGTFREADSSLANKMIRINPMRSGPDTVIRILKEAVSRVL